MWSRENSSQAFQAPVDVHASADGQVYMFKRRQNESAVSSDDEELNVMEIRSRTFQDQRQDKQSNVQLLEREVLDGDNLNKLALQYGCKVADLKRVNNLMHDQDLFALKCVKIPIQKHSLLSETLSETNDAKEERNTVSASPDRSRAPPHLQEATDFLMEMDNDLDRLIQTSNNRDDDDFLDLSEKPRRFAFRGRRPKSHGSDWGIQWWNAVIAMLLIGVALPLFYVIYFKTKDNGGASTAGSLLQPSLATPNVSVVGFSTKAPQHIQEPG